MFLFVMCSRFSENIILKYCVYILVWCIWIICRCIIWLLCRCLRCVPLVSADHSIITALRCKGEDNGATLISYSYIQTAKTWQKCYLQNTQNTSTHVCKYPCEDLQSIQLLKQITYEMLHLNLTLTQSEKY